jgi:hypothetical protein
MKTKILRNILLSVGVLFASTQLLSAGMNDGVLNFSKTPLVSLRATYTTFDIPDARDIFLNGINPAGMITGGYFDANLVGHGFLRTPDGTITAIDAPGSAAPFGTNPIGNNPAGAISGWYYDMSGVFHGSCALPTAPSPTSIRRAPQPRSPVSSTRLASSREITSTQAARGTGSCGFHDRTLPSRWALGRCR